MTSNSTNPSDPFHGQDLLEQILEVTSDGVFDWNIPSGRTYFSPQYYQMLGYDHREFPENLDGWRERVHPDDLSKAEAIIAQHFAEPDSPYRVEFRMRQKDGSWKWILARGKVVEFEPDGSPRRMIGTHIDISERKRAQDRYQQLFENLTTGFVLHEAICDSTGKMVDYRFLEVNPAYEKLTGLKASEVLGKRVLEILPGVESYWIDMFGKVAATGESVRFENFTAPLDRWYETWAYRPSPGHFAVLVTDITERKRQEEALRRSEEHFRFLAQNSIDIILRLSPRGEYLWASPSMKPILELDPESIVGTSAFSMIHPEDRPLVLAALQEALQGDEPRKAAYRHVMDSGRILWLESIGKALRDPATGEVTEVLVASRDITEAKEAERKIRELGASLEQRVAERTEELQSALNELESFSYTVSHDLRSPLRAIDGFSQALLEDASDRLEPESRTYLQRIRLASTRMAHLIDDLLELSRSSRLPIRRQEVDASALATDLLADLQAQEPGRKLTASVAGGIVFDADPVLLRSIMENLLGNAWKYTATRSEAIIDVSSELVDGRRWLQVRDNGIGFDMAHASKLFGTFQRLHSDPMFEGTGIGLATTRKLVERHGGSLTGNGIPDQGATFRFTLDPAQGA